MVSTNYDTKHTIIIITKIQVKPDATNTMLLFPLSLSTAFNHIQVFHNPLQTVLHISVIRNTLIIKCIFIQKGKQNGEYLLNRYSSLNVLLSRLNSDCMLRQRGMNAKRTQNKRGVKLVILVNDVWTGTASEHTTQTERKRECKENGERTLNVR